MKKIFKKETEEKSAGVDTPPMPEKPKGKSTFYLVASISSLVVGCFLFYLYFSTNNMLFGYIFIAPMVLGWWLWHQYKKKREELAEPVYTGVPISQEQVNSMNIYPPEKGGIKFENILKPEGQPKICVNDGKPYFIHIWDEATKRLKGFALPDQQYYDPRVFAERVLELPAHRKIFTRKQNLLQKLSPFILLAVIFAEWLIIITTTGPKGG